MAATYPTLAGLVKINDLNDADIDVTDLLQDAPVLAQLAAVMASNGTVHSYLKETGAPVVGFRAVSVGREHSASSDTEVTATLKLLDATWSVDQGLARGFAKGGLSAYLARESARQLKAAMFATEKQILNGVIGIGDAGGFVGLRDSLLIANAMTVNATGDTATTGSSMYGIRTGNDNRDLAVVAGGTDGTPTIEIGETVGIEKTSSGDLTYPAWMTPIFAYLGLQLGSAQSIGRIANLTAQSGKGLTDALIADLLAKFPASRMPTFLTCSRRSLFQLQASRTATNTTGAPAPIPTESFGYPIITTDAIGNVEAIIS